MVGVVRGCWKGCCRRLLRMEGVKREGEGQWLALV